MQATRYQPQQTEHISEFHARRLKVSKLPGWRSIVASILVRERREKARGGT